MVAGRMRQVSIIYKRGGTLTKAAPGLAICGVNLEDLVQVLDGFREIFASPQNGTDGVHRLN